MVLYPRSFFHVCEKLHLKSVSKLNFKFDPFSEKSFSLREFIFQLSVNRVKKTSINCVQKFDVVNDRSEPEVLVTLENQKKFLLKTENLSPLDICEQYLKAIEPFVVKEEVKVKVLTGRRRRIRMAPLKIID